MSHLPESRTPASAPSRRLIYAALAVAALLVLAALLLFAYASRTATGPQRGNTHKVVVNDSHCEPADFRLPAGLTTFEIHNASRRPLEWEILDGVMVVAERENIAPGFHSLLTVKLRPGQFAITCGLLSNPRGSLEVVPTADSEAERLRPPLQAFIGPLSENRVFLIMQANALVREAQALADAVATGDLATARTQWLAARLHYKHVEAVAGRWSDLENRIDPQADYLAGREDDPAFTGFHRLEKALFGNADLNGLLPLAQQLTQDAEQLKARVRESQQAPHDLADSALWQAQRLLESAIVQGENPYAQSDLHDLQANLQGMAKSVQVLDALLQGANAPLAAQLRQQQADLQAAVLALRSGDDFLPYRDVSTAQRAQLQRLLEAWAASRAQVNAALGLE